MGKSNRIRANRAASEKIQSLDVKKSKKGMPSWLLSLIIWVVTAAVLLTIVASLLSANGVFARATTALESDNYKINANMLSYFFYSEYQNFYNTYNSILSSMLDTNKSLKEQIRTEATDTTEAETWYDYFMDLAVSSATNVLIYCEEADLRGIELTDEELAEIDASIDSMNTMAMYYGYNLNAYISQMYGPGVTKTDVKKAMKYSALAQKCATAIGDELLEKIDSVRINEKYASAKKTDFDVIDYVYYPLDVSYSEIQKEMFGETKTLTNEQKAEVQKAYDEAVAEAKAKAEALKGKTDAESFKNLFVEYAVEDLFDYDYEELIEVKKEDLPSDEDIKAIKEAMMAELVAEVQENKTETAMIEIAKDAETVTAYGKTVKAAYAEDLNEVKSSVFSALRTEKTYYDVERSSHVKDDEFFKWAYEDGRVANETKVVETKEGEGEKQTFNVTAFMLLKLPAKDSNKTHNVAYMLFTSSDAAKAAITELSKDTSLTVEEFEEYAKTKATGGYTRMENYLPGSLGNSIFDSWLYDEGTTLGSMTKSYLTLGSNSYAVALYYAEGEEAWYETVKDAIFTEDSTAYEKALKEKHAIEVKDSALDKIDA